MLLRSHKCFCGLIVSKLFGTSGRKKSPPKQNKQDSNKTHWTLPPKSVPWVWTPMDWKLPSQQWCLSLATGLDLMGGITSRAESLYFIPKKFPLNFAVRVAAAKVLTSWWRWKWGCCSCGANSSQTHLRHWDQPGVCSVLEQLCKTPSEVFFVLFLPTMSYAISCLLSTDIKILPWIYLTK